MVFVRQKRKFYEVVFIFYYFSYNIYGGKMKIYTGIENPEKMVWNGFEYAVKNSEAIVTYYEGTKTEIAIPKIIEGNKVTKIADSLFTVPEIVSIIIPNGVTHIIDSFWGDTYNDRLSEENPDWFMEGEIVMDEKGEIQRISMMKENNLSYVELPQSLVSISNNAFAGCKKLSSITIPNSLVDIGERAFPHCKNIIIENSHPVYLVENSSLVHKETKTLHSYIDDCNRISYTISSGIEHIANEAFSHSKLENICIPNTVKTIGEYTFIYCVFLTNIEIPDSVISVGKRAFCNCEVIKSLTLPKGLECIESGTFEFCNCLEKIYIPNSVTVIEESAFFNCISLNTITLPSNLTKIGHSAFDMCSKLTKIAIPDSTTILEHSAFSSCENLERVTFSSTLTSIDSFAFCECIALKAIVIPETVTEIGQSAFIGCTSLTEVVMPESVIDIMDDAFSQCSKLRLKVKENSYAHEYAKKNGIEYEVLDF